MDDSSLSQRVEQLLEGAYTPTAVLVPSTADTTQGFDQWRRRWPHIASVAPLGGGLSGITLLGQLQEGNRPTRIVIFIDQLVSAVDATIPVRRGTTVSFHSGLECLLPLRYGYRLRCALARADEAEDIPDLPAGFAFTQRHLRRCRALGDAWLMRARQEDALLPARVRAARRQLRYLESALLHADAMATVDGAAAEIARVRDAQKQLRTTGLENAHVA